jgi:2,3-bisphosphoglycerate-independent phosphoglycerate mutase
MWRMKYLMVIGDGMADKPLDALQHKTPLGYLNLPAMARLAGSETGTALTVPEGVTPGSDTAILNIFGYDPRKCYTGRSVLEAAGVGVLLKEGEVSLRVNLCAMEDTQNGLVIRSHSGGSIEGDEAETLMRDLIAHPDYQAIAESMGLHIIVSRSFRHIGILCGPVPMDAAFLLTEPHNVLDQNMAGFWPKGYLSHEIEALMRASFKILDSHPVNISRRKRGLKPANMVWPWGPGRAITLPSFQEKYGHYGPVVSAVPLVWGIAALAGLKTPKVEGATGDLDTNYEGKVEAVLSAFAAGYDFAVLHVEAPDEMTHAGDLQKKLEAIRRLDQKVIAPLLNRLPALGDFRLLMLSDHLTLLSTRGHDGSPVPWAMYDSRRPGMPGKLDEETAATGLHLKEGTQIMTHLFEQDSF